MKMSKWYAIKFEDGETDIIDCKDGETPFGVTVAGPFDTEEEAQSVADTM
jgi:hypothetical protein